MRRGRKKRIPDASGAGDSFYVVAGTRCEVQQTDSPREIEVIPLTFEGQGRTMVLVGAGTGTVIAQAPCTVPLATSRPTP